DKAFVMSWISGGVAILLAYLLNRKSIRSKDDLLNEKDQKTLQTAEESTNKVRTAHLTTWSKIFAILVPLSLLIVVIYMMYNKLFAQSGDLVGGDGAAFVGGVAVILLLLSTVAFGRHHALDYISNHIT